MYKVFKGVYSIGDNKSNYLQIVNCDIPYEDSYLYIGYYRLKYGERVDIYTSSEIKIFPFTTKIISKYPLSCTDLFNLISLFNSAIYGDGISYFGDRELDIVISLQGNAKSNLLDRLYKALLFYDDYIELNVL